LLLETWNHMSLWIDRPTKRWADWPMIYQHSKRVSIWSCDPRLESLESKMLASTV